MSEALWWAEERGAKLLRRQRAERLPQEGSPGLGLKDEKERSRYSGLRGQRKPWGQRVWETRVSQFSFNFRAEGTGQ